MSAFAAVQRGVSHLKMFDCHMVTRDYMKQASLPATDKGERIYAIGDVHGRSDLLRTLMARIGEHSERMGPARSLHVVLLGDMIDRGPDSLSVLQWVHDVQKRSKSMIVLAGNHEELMVKALDGEPGMLRAWMRIGGDATVRSLGLEPPPRDADPRVFIDKVRAALPRDLLAWVTRLPLTARSGDYLFCHAGIRPGVPVHRQTRADLLWIRDEFLEDPQDHGVVVVHGHSIAAEVEMRRNRIGIDTGAYQTGMLTAVYLEGSEREIITVNGPAAPRQSPPSAEAA